MNKETAYQKLVQRSQEISYFNSATTLLGWDKETYMPQQAGAYRAKTIAHLSRHAHEMFVSPEFGELVNACLEDPFQEGSVEADNVRMWKYYYDRSTKLPADFVKEFAEVTNIANQAWKEARSKADYSIFAPHLEKVIELCRKQTDMFGYQDHPYDALLESHEIGMVTADVDRIFSAYKDSLIPLVQQAISSQKVSENLLDGHYEIDAQKTFCRKMAEAIGLDFSVSSIDTVTHPFMTQIGLNDVRITTRYNEKNFEGALFGTLHETGHAFYQLGLLEEYYSTPAGKSVSTGIHESQSLLWESHVGRSRTFWQKWYPTAVELLPELQRVSFDEFIQAINTAKRTFTRVEADEVTYDLHVILRFEIEKEIFTNNLNVADIPEAWNAKFKEYLGLDVPDVSYGCIQDVHWSCGGFGYFPCYSLGNIRASQIFHAAMQNQQVNADVQNAEYDSLLKWLNKNIHQLGSRYLPEEVMLKATGEKTNPEYHLAHLKDRYL